MSGFGGKADMRGCKHQPTIISLNRCPLLPRRTSKRIDTKEDVPVIPNFLIQREKISLGFFGERCFWKRIDGLSGSA
jgi:hypothetical protein